ncbi:DUF2946 family protein [Neorhodopirellula lusitana]|uniref:DUF2946 family protein n=1 Tax=Neorhodopirellula lusitana TaxID=445327 RepID=UPI00384F929F
MTSLFRPLVASLLCSLIVIGHAPAWLHVATCESESHAHVMDSASDTVFVCSHGCHHHATAPDASSSDADETVPASHDSSSPHEHDSSTCGICQSLAAPVGVTWELVVVLPVEFGSELTSVPPARPLSATLLSIPQPRGPPVVA